MRRRTKIFTSFALIACLTGAGVIYYFAEKTVLPPAARFAKREVVVKIPLGTPLTQIAKMLYEEGVIVNIKNFIFTANLFQHTNKVKAGQYQICTGLSNYDVLKILVRGKVSEEKISIPEGYTSRQIASLFQRKLEIDSTQFMQWVMNEDFTHSLGVEQPSLEGYLYPDTYFFQWGNDAPTVIKRLVNEFHRNYNDSLKQKTLEMGWPMNHIVTLASIIEGEAMLDRERSIISAVYHNRLRKGMLLQADPTIQYLIPDGPRRLLKRDLTIVSPYNTYLHPGLPPGPVNNPGIESIIAAIQPADVPYLFFVAQGDGSHHFSGTLQEHLRAKRHFDQYRREVNAKKR